MEIMNLGQVFCTRKKENPQKSYQNGMDVFLKGLLVVKYGIVLELKNK